jgi:hypothetical protein
VLIAILALAADGQREHLVDAADEAVQRNVAARPVSNHQLAQISPYLAADQRAVGQHVERIHDLSDSLGRVVDLERQQGIERPIEVVEDLERQFNARHRQRSAAELARCRPADSLADRACLEIRLGIVPADRAASVDEFVPATLGSMDGLDSSATPGSRFRSRGLEGAGYKYVQVKGIFGEAATDADDSETIKATSQLVMLGAEDVRLHAPAPYSG